MRTWAWTGAMQATLAALVVVALSPPDALADTNVPASPRPEIRPTDIAHAEVAAPTVALRPVPRPDGLSRIASAQAGTADPGLRHWIAGFRGRAAAAGIKASVLDSAFAGVQYDEAVIKLDRNQSEYTKPIWEYLDTAVSPLRIKNGKAALARHGDALSRIEARYGVDKEVVAAIWGMESAYGAARGARPLIASLTTLAHDGRRGAFFEAQLIAALKIVQSGDIAPAAMTGSWAGAMGHTQFMPTSYLAYAVDFTGDGRRDIWAEDPTDALASTAAYLAHFGWTKGQPWGVEVQLPDGFDPARARRALMRSPAAWAAEGIRDMQGARVPNHGRASILLPAGATGPAFMIFDNFGVIERYNKADAYVIGVGHLSDRLKGAAPIQAAWPRDLQPTTSAQKKEIQRRLRSRGYGVHTIDGIIGPNTITAIRAFQKSAGLGADGYPSHELLKALGG